MEFLTLIRLPDPTAQPPTEPTKLITQVIEREGGQVESCYGTNGGWDCVCIFECPTLEAQVRSMLTLHRAGFTTETRSLIEPEQLDKAWQNAVQHPAAATSR